MPKLSQKGLTHIFLVIILLLGIISGVYLVQKTQIFKPKASTGDNLQIVDANGNGFPNNTTDNPSVRLKINLPDGWVVNAPNQSFNLVKTAFAQKSCKSDCASCTTVSTCGYTTYDTCTDDKGQTGSDLCSNGATKFGCQAGLNSNCQSGHMEYSCANSAQCAQQTAPTQKSSNFFNTNSADTCQTSCGACKPVTTCGYDTYDTCTDNAGGSSNTGDLCKKAGATKFTCKASGNNNCQSGFEEYECSNSAECSRKDNQPQITQPTSQPKVHIIQKVTVENKDTDGSKGGSSPKEIPLEKLDTLIPWELESLQDTQQSAQRFVQVTLFDGNESKVLLANITLVKIADKSVENTGDQQAVSFGNQIGVGFVGVALISPQRGETINAGSQDSIKFSWTKPEGLPVTKYRLLANGGGTRFFDDQDIKKDNDCASDDASSGQPLNTYIICKETTSTEISIPKDKFMNGKYIWRVQADIANDVPMISRDSTFNVSGVTAQRQITRKALSSASSGKAVLGVESQTKTAVTINIAKGGTVSTARWSAKVPANVIKELTSLNFKVEEQTSGPRANIGTITGSTVWNMTATDNKKVAVTKLDKGVTITVKYTDADLALAGEAKQLHLQRYNETTKLWEDLENLQVDAIDRTVSGVTPHLSLFALVIVIPRPDFAGLPADKQGAIELRPNLRWNQASNTKQFHLQVVPANQDGPGINIIIGQPDLVKQGALRILSPKLDLGNYVLLPGMSYAWRVRTSPLITALGENDGGWSEFSEPRGFMTGSPSSVTISPVSPQDNKWNDRNDVESLTPTLQWSNRNDRIFYYEVQLSQDPKFETDPAKATKAVYWEIIHGGKSNPLNSYNVREKQQLKPSTKYYWRVRARVQGDGIPVEWSETWTFMTPK